MELSQDAYVLRLGTGALALRAAGCAPVSDGRRSTGCWIPRAQAQPPKAPAGSEMLAA